MSYILDALRRADAERERGEVPSLQSQQHELLSDEEPPARSRALVWVVAALSLALLGTLAWNFVGGEPPRPTAQGTVSPAPVPAPPPATAMPPLVVLPTSPAATMPSPGGAATASQAPSPATPNAPGIRPANANPAVASPTLPADRRAARHTAAASSTTARPALASVPTTTSRLQPETRIYAQAELPDEIRREIPKITIGGASYSGDAASRMVIINGQVFHEGNKITNGLVLEKIKLKAAVLAYKGWRYEITF
ncbi:MAG: general secretion pathway protein GspB [Caldimonas sp.]